MWGIIPAAGRGSRIQPLAFSKELLPVGSRVDGGANAPARSANICVERMILGGADKICFVISPGKSDILEYYGARLWQRQRRLCGAAAGRAACAMPSSARCRSSRPMSRWWSGCPTPSGFPSPTLAASARRHALVPAVPGRAAGTVRCRGAATTQERVREIRVKQQDAGTDWVWGAFKMPGRVFAGCTSSGARGGASDEYIGTLVNAYLAAGRRRGRRQGRRGLCRCRHPARLPRRPCSCSPRWREDESPAGAGRRSAGSPAAGRNRAKAAISGHDRNAVVGRGNPETGRGAGTVVPQSRSRGVRTAPSHFLGDYPEVKWRRFADAIPRGPAAEDRCSTSAAMPASIRWR